MAGSAVTTLGEIKFANTARASGGAIEAFGVDNSADAGLTVVALRSTLALALVTLAVPFAALSALLLMKRGGDAGDGEADSIRYLLSWFVVPFVVLSLASTKRGI